MPTHYGLSSVPTTYPAIAYPRARVPLAKKLELSSKKESMAYKTQPDLGYYWHRGGVSNFAGFSGMKYTAAMAAPLPVDSQVPFKEAASADHKFPYHPETRTAAKRLDLRKNIDHEPPKPKSFSQLH